ncbi:glycoside hydrolase family 3 protein [Georgenia satyanarayanai]|uniref:glycoside hydrolase family 3 protein n=1 Tax=Georgenia satyanarayanai TaxID=860221 RepID=UPI00203D83AD|nr:glycoside hydrolase family 3 protein [Georgenia satyanarayanai]MCM3661027.1 glycoside hydrolase family 3 protein [Georgenia satyanarayanai]
MSTRTAGARAGVATALGAGMLLASTVPAVATSAPDSANPIDHIVNAMTVDELIGQMTWTYVYGNSADDASMAVQNQARYGVDTPREVVEKFDLGGVLYFAWSNPGIVNDPELAAGLSNGLQAVSVGDEASGIPLATTIDQEGGIVARMGAPMTVLPGNMALGATFDVALARAQGEILGSELAAVGVNADFAPVVDVNTNPANPVIGVRSLGEDPQNVATLGVAQIEGMQSQGVGAAAKHFPGHGDTETDSHTGLPIVTYDRATLDQHLVPFEAAIDAGVDMIMTAHVIVEELDPEMPGTLSPEVLTGLLREDLGFDGLITTDALDMAALKQLPDNPLDDGDIAVLAIQAGSDILLMSPDVPATFEAVNAAVESGDITRERLEESVTRILEWKVERGVWEEDPSVPVDEVMDVVGSAVHTATAQEIANRSVTLLRNEGDLLPLDDGQSVFVTGWGQSGVPYLAQAFTDRGVETDHLYTANFPTAEQIAAAAAAAEGHDAIVLMTHTPANAAQTQTQRDLLAALQATEIPVVHVPVRNPYDVAWENPAPAQLVTYGYQRPSLQAVADVVLGAVEPTGKLPVNVPTAEGEGVLHPIGFGLGYEDEEPQQPAQRYGFFLTNGWSGGDADYAFQYGRYTDEVLVGDWDGDGRDSITVRRGNQYFVNNAPTGGPAERVLTYGKADDVVLVGDWNGDGTDTLAVRRGATYHVKNSLRGGNADLVVTYGREGDAVVVGDWDGDGRDTFAVRRGKVYHVKNAIAGGNADVVFAYGRESDAVLAGDWNGDGRDTFAVRRGRDYYVSNTLRGGPAEQVMSYGREGDEVFVGDWDGDGRDSIGVRRTPAA